MNVSFSFIHPVEYLRNITKYKLYLYIFIKPGKFGFFTTRRCQTPYHFYYVNTRDIFNEPL